jgi:type IV pilus assembly protein PilW
MDGDGVLDTYNAGGNDQVIWAVDSDGDNYLDKNLDTNGDGNIDENDGPGLGGNGLIGGTNISPVSIQDIRAVRIWMLARTEYEDNSFLNTKTYTVGNKVITPNNNLRMRLLVTNVRCRNIGP